MPHALEHRERTLRMIRDAVPEAANMQELRVAVPARLLAALDDYARAKGVSRAEAVRYALCCGPLVGSLLRMSEAGISLSDVTGP